MFHSNMNFIPQQYEFRTEKIRSQTLGYVETHFPINQIMILYQNLCKHLSVPKLNNC